MKKITILLEHKKNIATLIEHMKR